MTDHHRKPPPLVWVVDSAYTGEVNARIGLAERLGYGYDLIPMPNGGGSGKGYGQMLKRRYADNANHPPLLLISGTGEENTAKIANLRTLFAGRLFNIYLASILPDETHPRLSEYDLIASPQLAGPNIVTMTGVAHKLTHEKLVSAHRQYESYFNALPKPIIGLLIGGNTRFCNGFDGTHAAQLAGRIAKIGRVRWLRGHLEQS